ncbi:hypothetical protein [Rhodospira trueperi]|uniref:Uncharacterized protein n=1 Tax=Rhodospira trueperi TaxID=69960 RepID=A0A1G7D3Q7_9PROT|nr:hypothetical protein [Rhodospira trueperi]SDE46159.1 hypothetical protein SAMN05421720_10722 [Rhodospira trueperi]
MTDATPVCIGVDPAAGDDMTVVVLPHRYRRDLLQCLTLHDQGNTASARLGAYILGSDAAEAGMGADACPFAEDALPELAEAWRRGRQDTLDFGAGKRRPADRLSSKCRIRAPIGSTHAAHTHPGD